MEKKRIKTNKVNCQYTAAREVDMSHVSNQYYDKHFFSLHLYCLNGKFKILLKNKT